MSPVEFKKRPCRPVEFKDQWPQHGGHYGWWVLGQLAGVLKGGGFRLLGEGCLALGGVEGKRQGVGVFLYLFLHALWSGHAHGMSVYKDHISID